MCVSVVRGSIATLCISSVRHHDLVERPFSRLSQESSIKVLSSTFKVATYFCLINCLRNVICHTFDHSLFFLIFLGCTSYLLFGFGLFHCCSSCLTLQFFAFSFKQGVLHSNELTFSLTNCKSFAMKQL